VDSLSLRHFPPPPTSVTVTELGLAFINELALKIIFARGNSLARDIADAMKLPLVDVVNKSLEYLRRERLIQVQGATGAGEATYVYALTAEGQIRAREMMERNQYVGPAPVSLTAYAAMVERQSLSGIALTLDAVKRALAHLVLNDALIEKIGVAINSARSIFLFGNSGDGKTSIGTAIGTMLPGAIWIPYAIIVEGQIIKVFDPGRHRVIAKKTESESAPPKGLLHLLTREKIDGVEGAGIGENQRYDERWVLAQRPLIVGAGEMTLKGLDLVYDSKTKYYEASQQMKANGGVFLLDDLGRQPVAPRAILNRWIVPLEKKVDYLTLATGFKFEVPFDLLVIFATNLNPVDLVDEAFLRRVRHKIHVQDPTWEEYKEILKREASKRNILYSDEGAQYLISEYYLKPKRQPRGVHPRDALDALVEIAHFQGVPPTMSKPLIDLAGQAYFMAEHRES